MAADRFPTFCAALAVMCFLSGAAWGQGQSPSLAEAARSARKQRPPVQSVKVYDNDNLPKEGQISVIGVKDSPARAERESQRERDADIRDEERKEWQAMIAEQELHIADLQDAFNRLERDNRTLKAEYEDSFTGKPKPQPCAYTYNWVMYNGVPVAGECVVMETPRLVQYRQYVEEREARKAELQEAQDMLRRMNEEARRRHINLER